MPKKRKKKMQRPKEKTSKKQKKKGGMKFILFSIKKEAIYSAGKRTENSPSHKRCSLKKRAHHSIRTETSKTSTCNAKRRKVGKGGVETPSLVLFFTAGGILSCSSND